MDRVLVKGPDDPVPHRLVHHSTLGLRVIKKKNVCPKGEEEEEEEEKEKEEEKEEEEEEEEEGGPSAGPPSSGCRHTTRG